MKHQHYELDHYAAKAKKLQYRSRAAFKLLEINKSLKIFKPGMKVLDLGAAPGSWCQVVHELIGPSGIIFGLDILPIQPYKNVIFIQEDINNIDYVKLLQIANSRTQTTQCTTPKLLHTTPHTNSADQNIHNVSQSTPNTNTPRLTFDVVLCDICPNKTGNNIIDSHAMHQINFKTVEIAKDALSPNGILIMKIFQDSHTATLTKLLQSTFTKIKFIKPDASRKISSEIFYYAQGLQSSKH